eukprot:6782730-Alexandrium_andersonii.AAC.1
MARKRKCSAETTWTIWRRAQPSRPVTQPHLGQREGAGGTSALQSLEEPPAGKCEHGMQQTNH